MITSTCQIFTMTISATIRQLLERILVEVLILILTLISLLERSVSTSGYDPSLYGADVNLGGVRVTGNFGVRF